jgi:BlaI family penicillinase repressor
MYMPAETDKNKRNGSGTGSAHRPERISEAEHAVMETLWDRSPLTALEICEEVCARRDWSLATVKTLLSRLVAKQAVVTQPDGRRFLYTPVLERSDHAGAESRRLVDRLFGGRAAPLFAQLAESEALTQDDLAEMEALLKELRK